MSKLEKVLDKVLRGTSDTNIDFEELCQLLYAFGFVERIRGSHHIFVKDNVVEIINLQSQGSKAKPCQVKQVRNLILKYKLAGEND
jgi:predicted RNA binding protein YcfA (HicA-like mRNA interferase family)